MSILRSVALVAICVVSQSLVGCSGNEVTTPPTTQPTPKKYLVTSSNQSPVAGSSVTITAQLVDPANNAPLPVAGRVVLWSDQRDVGSFASPTSTTDVGGKATVVYTTTTRAGAAHRIRATEDDDDDSAGASVDVVTIAGPPTHYRMGVIPDVVVAGNPVSVSASVFDVNENQVRVSGRVVTWTSSGTGGSFSAATSLTDKDGSVTVNFRTSATVGVTHVVTATDSSGFKGSTTPIVTVVDDGFVFSVLSSGG